MLGMTLRDPHHVEEAGEGLGLLPLVTDFNRRKAVRPRTSRFGTLSGVWSVLSGFAIEGYEIHYGQTKSARSTSSLRAVMPGNLAWQNKKGNILGLYLHGLFENPAVLQALFGAGTPARNDVFEGMADFIDRHFQPGVLKSLVGKRS